MISLRAVAGRLTPPWLIALGILTPFLTIICYRIVLATMASVFSYDFGPSGRTADYALLAIVCCVLFWAVNIVVFRRRWLLLVIVTAAGTIFSLFAAPPSAVVVIKKEYEHRCKRGNTKACHHMRPDIPIRFDIDRF